MQRQETAGRSISKRTLSTERRRLVEVMQDLNFGRIEGVAVRDGEPVWDPAPRTLRDIRLRKSRGPHRMRGAPEFTLRAEVVELLEFFDRERSLLIETLDVQHGLPHRMVVACPGGE